MNPFLEGDYIYVNWPVAQGDLPQARKSASPKPTKDIPAPSVGQLEAREDSMFPTMRRCIRHQQGRESALTRVKVSTRSPGATTHILGGSRLPVWV